MRKLVASALLAGLVLLPAAQASAASPRGGGGGMVAATLGLARVRPTQAGSRVGGSVFVAYNAQHGKMDVVIEISGLVPNSVHPAHIHAGQCTSNGPVLFPLPTLHANAQGVAISALTDADGIDARRIPPTGPNGWYVNVHQGPGLTGAQFTPIACGEIRRASGAAVLDSQAGSNAQGLALLATRGSSTDVVVLATGLEPGTKHPEHIHQGTCGSNGPVIYPLPLLTADDNGIAISSANIPTGVIPSSGWYINIHQGPGLTGAQFTPIACGNVSRAM